MFLAMGVIWTIIGLIRLKTSMGQTFVETGCYGALIGIVLYTCCNIFTRRRGRSESPFARSLISIYTRRQQDVDGL
jgi:hypothetical protein